MTINDLQSTEINELIKAFVEAKKEYGATTGDAKGNYGKYMTMDAVKEVTEEALLNHGLIFKQNRVFLEGCIMLESKLMHTSGQWMAGYMPLTIPDNPKDIDQAYGRATTYQRRYDAYGFLGLGKGDGTEDPDEPERPQRSYQDQPKEEKSDFISPAQVNKLRYEMKGDKELEQTICNAAKIKDLSQLPWKNMQQVLEFIQKKINASGE